MENSNIQILAHDKEAFVLVLDINGDIARVFHITVSKSTDGLAMDHAEINISDYYNLLQPEMECPEAGCTGKLQKDEESNCLACLDCGFSLPSGQ